MMPARKHKEIFDNEEIALQLAYYTGLIPTVHNVQSETIM
jgi:hypothetical protein